VHTSVIERCVRVVSGALNANATGQVCATSYTLCLRNVHDDLVAPLPLGFSRLFGCQRSIILPLSPVCSPASALNVSYVAEKQRPLLAARVRAYLKSPAIRSARPQN
jgi:hypothetical protein